MQKHVTDTETSTWLEADILKGVLAIFLPSVSMLTLINLKHWTLRLMGMFLTRRSEGSIKCSPAILRGKWMKSLQMWDDLRIISLCSSIAGLEKRDQPPSAVINFSLMVMKHPLGTMNHSTKFCANPPSRYWDISRDKCRLLGVEVKSGVHQGTIHPLGTTNVRFWHPDVS